ncbi:GNAT family N-acetyltransferase [Arenibacterium sp. CAU 1754]
MNRSIPTINTSRVILRAMRLEDFDRFSEIWAMPDVVHHITGRPRSRAESWDSFLRNAGHWQMTGFGQWAVIEQRSREMIGQVGFFYGSEQLGEDFDGFPQAGWALVPQAQGSGLALEATRAAHDWFDRVIPGPLVARIAEDNTGSCQLAQRLGYHVMRNAPDQEDPTVLMRRDGPGTSH